MSVKPVYWRALILTAFCATGSAFAQSPDIPRLRPLDPVSTVEAPKLRTLDIEPKTEPPKLRMLDGEPKVEVPKVEVPKLDPPKVEAPKDEPAKLPSFRKIPEELPIPVPPPDMPQVPRVIPEESLVPAQSNTLPVPPIPATPQPVPAVPQSVPALPPVPAVAPPTTAAPPKIPTLPPHLDPIPPDPYLSTRPIPGSLADTFPTELEARGLYRTYTTDGSYVTAFPTTLLWESPVAVLRDPRMAAIMTNQQNFRSSNTLETSIGGTIGIYRYEPVGHDLKIQFDIFGVVHTRLTPEEVTVADYRFGFPLTWQWSNWHGKFAYEHTSSHIGDRFIRATGAAVYSQNKDEAVVGLGHYVTPNTRLYMHLAYAFQDLNVDRIKGPFRADAGVEWYMRKPTGLNGTPYLAANVEYREDQNYSPNYTAQAGWLWRNPYQRLGSFRLYAEYYRGYSPYSQFYRVKEDFYGFGFAFDF